MSTGLVSYAVTDQVGHIRFTRPDKLNALTPRTFSELDEALGWATSDDAVRAIVVSGEGRAFAAGADIGDYVGLSKDDFRQFIAESRRVVDEFALCPKPIIAAVQGFALGGGFELVLACDLVVAVSNARFGLPEAGLGLLPGGGGTQRLTRLVGRIRANELIMTRRLITADEALSWGVVNRVCAKDELDNALAAIVAELKGSSSEALAVAKEIVAAGEDLALPDGLDLEAKLTAPLIDSANGREGIDAFVQKRMPEFTKSHAS